MVTVVRCDCNKNRGSIIISIFGDDSCRMPKHTLKGIESFYNGAFTYIHVYFNFHRKRRKYEYIMDTLINLQCLGASIPHKSVRIDSALEMNLVGFILSSSIYALYIPHFNEEKPGTRS